MSDPKHVTLSLDEVVMAYRSVRAVDTALAEQELNSFLLVLLASFAECPGVRIGAVATTLGFTAAVATSGVNRLEDQGLVRRIEKSISDRSRDRRTV